MIILSITELQEQAAQQAHEARELRELGLMFAAVMMQENSAESYARARYKLYARHADEAMWRDWDEWVRRYNVDTDERIETMLRAFGIDRNSGE